MSAVVPAGYKQTAVGVIPENWEVSNVGDAFNVHNHLRFPISHAVREQMNGDYPYYGPTSVQGWINEYRAEGEYALIGEDGDHFLKWRTQAMTLLVQGKFNVNNHAHLVQGSKNLTTWFYWFFTNRDITSSLTRQGASRYKLNKATLLKLPCLLPPLPEQSAIAAALSDVDALLARLDQLIAKKRNLKQAAMQQLLTGQTRLPGFSVAWEVKRLGDMASATKGSQLKKSESGDTGKFAHLNGGITPSGFTKFANTPGQTIAISEGGNSCGFVQFMAVPFWSGGHCYSIVPTRIDKSFLYHALKGRQEDIMGLRVGSGLPNVQKSALLNFSISCPLDRSEQTAIATLLSDMDTELAAMEARAAKTCALKHGMMQELLTGRIRLV